MDLVKSGSVPNVTHTYAEPSKRLNNDLYCKMTHDGCIIAGGDCRENRPGQPFDQEQQTESLNYCKDYLTRIFPFIGELPIDRKWTGLMPFSPDGVPIIGQLKCLPGKLYLSTGMHGEGMSLSSGAGELLARMIMGDAEAIKLLGEADPDRCCHLDETL